MGGGENYQIYHFAWATGRKTLLTDGKSRNTGLLLSRDGKSLVYSSTRRNGKDFDIWHLNLAAKAPAQLIYQGQGSWSAEDWSPAGTEILLKLYVSANESELHRFDLKTKAKTALVNLGGRKAAFSDARYAPKGDGAYFASDAWGEFLQLAHVDFATGQTRRLSTTIPWDVEEIEVSGDGEHLAFVANEDGVSRLRLLRLPKESPVVLADGMPQGLVSGLRFDAEGRRLGFTSESAVAPGDAYVIDLKSKRPQRWTESEVGGLDPAGFSAPTLVHFPTFDEFSGQPRRIPAFVYKPKGEGPFPTVVLIHGGPESQHRPNFSSTIQYWTGELGLAVVAPNVRGSSGYGKSYLLLDNGSLREDSVKDIGALLDWLAERPDFDAERRAVYGGSYGGYMVLASLARYGEKLKAGVDVVGISNFVTFLESTQEYRRDLRRAEYGDERDPILRDFLESISPTNLAGDIKAPLFVAQGANDPRVPASEAEQIVTAVGSRGLPVWYLLAEDEGHGFAKKKNRDYFSEAVSLFWERHLLERTP